MYDDSYCSKHKALMYDTDSYCYKQKGLIAIVLNIRH